MKAEGSSGKHAARHRRKQTLEQVAEKCVAAALRRQAALERLDLWRCKPAATRVAFFSNLLGERTQLVLFLLALTGLGTAIQGWLPVNHSKDQESPASCGMDLLASRQVGATDATEKSEQ